MGILQDSAVSQRWFRLVSPLYDPFVGEAFWPERLQRRLLADLPLAGEDRVLDVGCGTGVTSRCLAERAGRVDAIDHSRPQLSRARATSDDRESTDVGGNEASDSAAVHWTLGDAAALPYRDDAFDAVVSVGAVLYFPDPVAVLAEARRVTRSGGRLLVAGFNRLPFPSWNPAENWASVANETLFETADREKAREQVTAAGWTDVETRVTGLAWHPRLIRVTTGRVPR